MKDLPGSGGEANASELQGEANNVPHLCYGKDKEQQPPKFVDGVKSIASDEAEISISRLDIRVGLITNVQKLLDDDSFFVEEIDVGEGQRRTTVTRLGKYISLEDMQNRRVCVICNLKPAAIKGIKTQAMILTASNSDFSKVELVEPPELAAVGERVTFPGFEGDVDGSLDPRKKIWETIQAALHTDGELVACYNDAPFTTSAGVCKASSISNGTVSLSCDPPSPEIFRDRTLPSDLSILLRPPLGSEPDLYERMMDHRLVEVITDLIFDHMRRADQADQIGDEIDYQSDHISDESDDQTDPDDDQVDLADAPTYDLIDEQPDLIDDDESALF